MNVFSLRVGVGWGGVRVGWGGGGGAVCGLQSACSPPRAVRVGLQGLSALRAKKASRKLVGVRRVSPALCACLNNKRMCRCKHVHAATG